MVIYSIFGEVEINKNVFLFPSDCQNRKQICQHMFFFVSLSLTECKYII